MSVCIGIFVSYTRHPPLWPDARLRGHDKPEEVFKGDLRMFLLMSRHELFFANPLVKAGFGIEKQRQND